MSQTDLRRRMRGSDAMFLYFERKEMPLHIGCVAVLDGQIDKHVERLLAARLPEIPRYRQRVIVPPLNLTHPTWEDDPDFDISNHIRYVTLDPPGSEAQLSELSGRIFTELMDRKRPLWDLTVVDGLEGGKSAMILRIHHCMVDGISGIALTNILFDTTPTPRVVEPQPWNPPPLPTSQEALIDGLSGIWADAAERIIGGQVTLLRLAEAFAGNKSGLPRKALLAAVPELLRPTEKLPFNGPCSGARGYCWTKTLFAEARAIRTALGGTINDVVLSVVTGAVMRYVKAHREPLRGRFVRMMVPVNLRAEDPHGEAGNEISMIPLSVPLDIDDPGERFREIAKRSSIMKAGRIADIIQLIGTGIGWTPPALQQSLAALPFMPQPVPIVNMVCTNVPGPMIPLYVNGRELLTYYPHVPCGSDVGISVAISSYNKHLFYGVTYDVQAAPDGELFRDFLDESYLEIREAAGVPAMPVPVHKPAPSMPPVTATEPAVAKAPAPRAAAMAASAAAVGSMTSKAVNKAKALNKTRAPRKRAATRRKPRTQKIAVTSSEAKNKAPKPEQRLTTRKPRRPRTPRSREKAAGR